jgi:hypothetical protein
MIGLSAGPYRQNAISIQPAAEPTTKPFGSWVST